MSSERIAILDFGSQFSQLIARRVREAHVYCELFPWDAPMEKVMAIQPSGIILSGGPNSVYDDGAPTLPDYVIKAGVPILGICYGMHLLAHALGGEVVAAARREYGPAGIRLDTCGIWSDAPADLNVWMSHGDSVTALPPGLDTHTWQGPAWSTTRPDTRASPPIATSKWEMPLGPTERLTVSAGGKVRRR